LITAGFLLLATLISAFLFLGVRNTNNISLIYVLAIVLIARYTSGYHPGCIASVISVIIVNFIFTFPYGKVNFTIAGYPVTFIGMLSIALITSTMTTHMKKQAKLLNEREKQLMVDFEKRLVLLNGESIHLTQIEYKIVSLLARNAGKVLTYDTILTHVWGPYIEQNNQILRVNMANVRRKLEKNPGEPQYIFTEVGIGYRMAEET